MSDFPSFSGAQRLLELVFRPNSSNVASCVASLLLQICVLVGGALPDESAFLEHRRDAACGEFPSPNFQTRHRFLTALGSFLLIYQQIKRKIEGDVPDVPDNSGNPTHTRMRMRTCKGSFKNAVHSPQMTVLPGQRVKKHFLSRHTTRHTNSRHRLASVRITRLIRDFSVVERRFVRGGFCKSNSPQPFRDL